MNIKNIWIALPALFCAACDDSTSSLGIYDTNDEITSSYSSFDVKTTSIKVDSVLGNSNTCYFGQIVDPETKSQIRAEFLAQFYTLENYTLPQYDIMVKDENGKVKVDSVDIRLYYESYFGDGGNVMKMSVYELDTANVPREDTLYYTDVKLEKYINPLRTEPLAKKMISPLDYTVGSDNLSGSGYYKNIRISLPNEYGQFVLGKYYENPGYFKDSYQFIHHVCPGFYFSLTDGIGSMYYLDIGTFSIYFTYKDKVKVVNDKNEVILKDTVLVGVSRFAATPEVIQSTRIDNRGIEQLISETKETECTLLKTPAGVYTEVELPIEDIYRGHERDSVNKAELSFTRYNSSLQTDYSLGVPQQLLMVRKSEMYTFFEEKKTVDSNTSFISTFEQQYNRYSYGNISRLIAHCFAEKRTGVEDMGGDEAAWLAENPDWNKVVLIPVTMTSSNNVTTVTCNMGMNSVRLVGENKPVELNVIYSKFNR